MNGFAIGGETHAGNKNGIGGDKFFSVSQTKNTFFIGDGVVPKVGGDGHKGEGGLGKAIEDGTLNFLPKEQAGE